MLATPHSLYEALGPEPAARAREYRGLFHGRLEVDLVEQIRRATNGNYALGTARFAAEVGAMLGRRAIPGRAGRPRRSTESEVGGE